MNCRLSFSILLLVLACINSSGEKLDIYVVPHSHCDPGWWHTIEQYFDKWTKGIIDSLVTVLTEDPERTAVWAEISFFEMWWREAEEGKREMLRVLVRNGQWEFVTGGWVSNDEASVHYNDMINQITEGNEFLRDHFGVVPKVGWSIDPFGHSTTMAYMLKKMGFEYIVINRIHSEIKDNKRDNKNLEFIWHQDFEDASNGIFTHVLAYPYYDIPNTCGPDRSVCVKFDFETPEARREPLTDSNIKSKAETLMDQYTKKSKSFRTNQLLIPLGDDFKYKTVEMSNEIFENYEKLFDEISSAGVANIKFSTLEQYFEGVKLESRNGKIEYKSEIGDFFTYHDKGGDYWSGYFTTRPFLKRASRQADELLRHAESLFIWNRAKGLVNSNSHFDAIEKARRNIALVQHHDAITGTARAKVVEDYMLKLQESKGDLKRSISALIPSVISSSGTVKVIEGEILKVTVGQKLVFHNSLGQSQKRMITLLVSNTDFSVSDQYGSYKELQFVKKGSYYVLYFVATVPPLGASIYEFREEIGTNEIISPVPLVESVDISNEFYRITTSANGLINKIFVEATQKEHSIEQEIVSYRVGGGAYVFKTNGAAQELKYGSPKYFKGELSEEVWVDVLVGSKNVGTITSSLYKESDESPSIIVNHNVNIQGQSNFEIMSRFNTNLDSEFYTDKNGLGAIKRTHNDGRTIAANYYPLTVGAYLLDKQENTIFRAITSQALGSGSLSQGSIEFCLDRTLARDDGKGLGEGVKDNQNLNIPIWITLGEYDEPTGDMVVGDALTLKMNFPPLILLAEDTDSKPTSFSPLKDEMPASVHLLSFKPRSRNNNEVILRLSLQGHATNTETIHLDDFFNSFTVIDPKHMSLSLLYPESEIKRKTDFAIGDVPGTGDNWFPTDPNSIYMTPMDIKTLLFTIEDLQQNPNRPNEVDNNNGDLSDLELGRLLQDCKNKYIALEKKYQKLDNERNAPQIQSPVTNDPKLSHSTIVLIIAIGIIVLLYVALRRKISVCLRKIFKGAETK